MSNISNYYQPLFDLMHSEHGLILLESDMSEIIRCVEGLKQEEEKSKYMPYEDDEDDEDRSGDVQYCRLCDADWELGEECSINCPNNGSPYAQLLRDGYD